jgi:hypothetical protein
MQHMDEARTGYEAKFDPAAGTLTLVNRNDKKWTANFSLKRSGPDRLSLDGSINGQKATLQLRQLDHTKFLLTSRGFHWIQDYPFNR